MLGCRIKRVVPACVGVALWSSLALAAPTNALVPPGQEMAAPQVPNALLPPPALTDGGVARLPPIEAPSLAVPVPIPPSASPVPATAAAPTALAPLAALAPIAPAQQLGAVTTITAAAPLQVAPVGHAENLWNALTPALLENTLAPLALQPPTAGLRGLARELLRGALTLNSLDQTAAHFNIRIAKLLELGDSAGAWQLAQLPQAPALEPALRLRLLELTLLTRGHAEEACRAIRALSKPPEALAVMAQRLLIVCQLRAGETEAALAGLNGMRVGPARDDFFVTLVTARANPAQPMPRQVTPLKPVNLALLRLDDRPVPRDLYVRPEAAVIPALLDGKTETDDSRLKLAEGAAASGLIDVVQLKQAYMQRQFPREQITLALSNAAADASGRALLVQAMEIDLSPDRKMQLVEKFWHGLPPAQRQGALTHLAAAVIDTVKPAAGLEPVALTATEIMLAVGRMEAAKSWYNIAPLAASTMTTRVALQPALWLSDLVEPEAALKLLQADPLQNATLANKLMVLRAAGCLVPESVSADTGTSGGIAAPAALLQQMQQAAAQGHGAETALLALVILNGTSLPDHAPTTVAAVIAALRQVGRSEDAMRLARDWLTLQG